MLLRFGIRFLGYNNNGKIKIVDFRSLEFKREIDNFYFMVY